MWNIFCLNWNHSTSMAVQYAWIFTSVPTTAAAANDFRMFQALMRLLNAISFHLNAKISCTCILVARH